MNTNPISPDVQEDLERLRTENMGLKAAIGSPQNLEDQFLRIRKALDSTNDAIAMGDVSLQCAYLNRTFASIYEYTVEDLNQAGGMRALFVDRSVSEDILKTLAGEKDWAGNADLRARSGKIVRTNIRVECMRDANDKIIGCFGIYNDIRERERADERLRLLEAAIETANDTVLVTEAEPINEPGPRILYVNEAFTSMTGYTPEEVFGKSPRLLQGQKSQRSELDRVRAALEAWEPVRAELINYRKDGSEFWVEMNIVPVSDEKGIYTHWVSIQRDITQRKLEEERRQEESEQRYRQLFNASPQPMWVYDVETLRFLAVNEAAVRLYGYSHDEFLSMTLQDIRPKEDIPLLLQAMENGGYPPNLITEWQHHKKDGSLISVEISSSPLVFAGRSARLVLAADITEKKRLEQIVIQAQKMESIGRLAGGIAHDFNNMLMAILGYEMLAREELEESHPAQTYLANLELAASRAAGLTRQMLTFARKQVMEPKVIDLNSLLLRIEPIIRTLIGANINLLTLPGSHLWYVKADPSQLEQALINLVVNARDAMQNGGKLIIETTNFIADEKFSLEHPDILPEDYVRIAVTDSGEGMTTEARDHIFEPFFTTKEFGRGTGLGMASCYGIIKQCDGHICVNSEPGFGTSVHIYLPAVTDSIVSSTASVKANGEIPGGMETILLVEDEPHVRNITVQALRQWGYNILEASNGAEALRIASGYSGRIDLLVTDVVMPNLGGKELANRLRQSRPEMKQIFMSGYTNNEMDHDGILTEGITLLQKPFAMPLLAHTVREILDKAESSK